MTHFLEEQGRALLRNGFRILPIEPGTKSPNLKGWTAIKADDATLNHWLDEHKASWGVGILGEETPAVDLDIVDEGVLSKMLAFCDSKFGEAPRRIGRAPRLALVFRTDAPFGKFKSRKYVDERGDTHQVEIIGKGGQFVAYAIHPDTKKPYAWPGGDLTDHHADLLPALSEQDARSIVAYFESIVPPTWQPVQSAAGEPGEHPSNPAKTASLAAIESAVRAIPNADLDYDDWIRVGYALWSAVGHDKPTGCAIFHEWSAKSDKYDPDVTQAAWDGIKEVKSIGAGTLFHLAEGAGWTRPRADAASEFEPIDIDVGEPPAEILERSEKPAPAGKLVRASDFAGLDKPERQFLVDDFIPHRSVTILGGDGGTGKSLLALQLAIATTLDGARWVGKDVQRRGPSLYFSAEDDEDETHIRLKDICEAEGLPIDDLSDLHIALMAGADAVLATEHVQGAVVKKTPLFDRLRKWMTDLRPVLLVLDNLVDVFGGSQNSPPLARQFVGMLRGLAIEFDCSVILLAHPSLSGMASGTGTAGTTAWNNSARSRLYLQRHVTEDNAEPDPNRRVLESMKANYAPTGLTVDIRWDRGRFVALDDFIVEGAEVGDPSETKIERAERVFLKLVKQFGAEKRHASPALGMNYAPTVFARHPGAEGVHKNYLEMAMNNLFARGVLLVDRTGSPSKQRQNIVLARDV